MKSNIIIVVLIGLPLIPFFIEGLKTHRLRAKWRRNSTAEAIRMILEDIGNAKKRMLFYSGEGAIYEDKQIINALEKTTIPIKMTFENELSSSSELSKLKKKDNIQLNFVKEKSYQNHFRVVDYNYVYLEKPHPAGSDKRFFKRFPGTRFLPAKYAQKYYQIAHKACPV